MLIDRQRLVADLTIGIFQSINIKSVHKLMCMNINLPMINTYFHEMPKPGLVLTPWTSRPQLTSRWSLSYMHFILGIASLYAIGTRLAFIKTVSCYMSEVPIFQKVHLSEGPYVRRITCLKVQISKTTHCRTFKSYDWW